MYIDIILYFVYTFHIVYIYILYITNYNYGLLLLQFPTRCGLGHM